MKKLGIGLLCASIVFCGVTAFAAEPAKFHIGICTGTVSQSEDDLRGAEKMIERYGDAAHGGMIKHITYPDNFMQEQETTISQISSFADDPLMKVVVTNQGIPGTTEAYRRIREKRPDILLFVGNAMEDPGVIESAADLIVDPDNVARGYLIPAAAQKLGCKSFVHISFPRHMSYELLSRRRRIMEEACKELGMNFYFETAPDPTSDVGVAGAQQFILEKLPQWIANYGPDTAFFCTNDAHTEPLLKRIAENQGYFIEADLPSPLMGYPGALGVELADVAGNFPAILNRVEQAVVKAGGSGRMGTWAYSYGFYTTVALCEYGKSMIERGIDARKFRRYLKPSEVFVSYESNTPGAAWNGSTYIDINTNVKKKNHLLVYQDDYIFGKGYLNMTDLVVPEKFLKVK